MSRFDSIVSLAVALLAAAVWIGCGGADDATTPAENAESAGSAGALETEPRAVPAPGPQMDVSESEGLPKGFPEDVPVYPGAEGGPAVKMDDMPTFAMFRTGDGADRVLEFYAGALADHGWAIEDTNERVGRVIATKDDRKATIRLTSRPDGGTEIAVILGS